MVAEEPLFRAGDWVRVRPGSVDNFPAAILRRNQTWRVEGVRESVPGSPRYGHVVKLEGFNEFHESWFERVAHTAR